MNLTRFALERRTIFHFITALLLLGGLELPGTRLRIEVTGAFVSPEDIGELAIRRSVLDTVASATTDSCSPRFSSSS